MVCGVLFAPVHCRYQLPRLVRSKLLGEWIPGLVRGSGGRGMLLLLAVGGIVWSSLLIGGAARMGGALVAEDKARRRWAALQPHNTDEIGRNQNGKHGV
jgi:hypothetical protein